MHFLKKIHSIKLYSIQFINSFKTVIACILGFSLESALKLPFGQWVVITIIVIMSSQTSLGGAIKVSYIRMMGTTLGALIAAFTLLFFPTQTDVKLIILTLSILFFSYIAASPKEISKAGTLGAVTVVIILMSDNPTLSSAALRFMEIILGIIIALIVSQLLFPVYAHNLLRNSQVDTIKNLINLYKKTVGSLSEIESKKEHLELDEKIISALATQKKLISEASAEIFVSKTKKNVVSKIIYLERAFFRTINFMYLCLSCDIPSARFIHSSSLFNELNKNIVAIMEIYASILNGKKQLDFSPTLNELKKIYQALDSLIHSQYNTKKHQELVNIHTFLFGINYLISECERFGELIKKL